MRFLPFYLATLLLLSACGIVYKQPIYQGNLISQEAVSQLHPGMTPQEVSALLGTPSIADPFQTQRWDYTASQRVDRLGRTQIKNFTVFFQNDRLVRWEGQFFANQDEFLSQNAKRQFGPNLTKNRQQ